MKLTDKLIRNTKAAGKAEIDPCPSLRDIQLLTSGKYKTRFVTAWGYSCDW
ncbi:MAG: hypothetical protein LBE22_04830 [Azoarcus sp.]|jgi:hypothetical protein|nr:hypothetical protein [Azoarcus sp.]